MSTTLLHSPPLSQEFAPRIARVPRSGAVQTPEACTRCPQSRGTAGRWRRVEGVEGSGGLSQLREPHDGAAARRHRAGAALRSHDMPRARRRGRTMRRPAAAGMACSATSRGGGGEVAGTCGTGGSGRRRPAPPVCLWVASHRAGTPHTATHPSSPAADRPAGPAGPTRSSRPSAGGTPGRTTCRAHVARVAGTVASWLIRRHFSRPRDGQPPPPDPAPSARRTGPVPKDRPRGGVWRAPSSGRSACPSGRSCGP